MFWHIKLNNINSAVLSPIDTSLDADNRVHNKQVAIRKYEKADELG